MPSNTHNAPPIKLHQTTRRQNVLTPVLGPTAVLMLRTLSLVARTGPTTWHLADLAGMHGVTISKTRAALTRLHRFGWLDEDADTVHVRLRGYLSEHTLARLHPALVHHYLNNG